jgi:cobalt-zinc-cadmium efflux system outer membrane protein
MIFSSKVLCQYRLSTHNLLIHASLLCFIQAHAEDVPSFGVLLRQGLSQAPILLEQSANIRAATANIQQAKAYLNPSISGLSENLNTRADYIQHTVLLTQPFEIGGKRAARIEARSKDLLVAETRDQEIHVLYAAELATAYAMTEAMHERMKVAENDISRANDDTNAAKTLVESGREASLRVSQAQANLSAAEAAFQAAEANFIEAMVRLSALAGSTSTYTGLGESFTTRILSENRAKKDDSETSPAIRRAQAEHEALLSQVTVEEKRSIPNIEVSAGVRHFEGISSQAFVIAFGSAIPIFDQNKGGIAAANERAIAAEARLNATKLQVNANQQAATAQVNASERRLKAAREGERAATQAYQLAKTGYEAGKTPLIELLFTRKSLTDAKLSTIDASFTFVKSLATLAAAEGRIAFGDFK